MRADAHVQAECEPKPYFATAGNAAQFFVVSEDITTECALEGASMFCRQPPAWAATRTRWTMAPGGRSFTSLNGQGACRHRRLSAPA